MDSLFLLAEQLALLDNYMGISIMPYTKRTIADKIIKVSNNKKKCKCGVEFYSNRNGHYLCAECFTNRKVNANNLHKSATNI